ncbi:nuclease-related domain-containing protein [Streptomyces sp. NPDC051992]|uniref:nuclease-related domain-containing protein n=1 Tax=Streptomyces sp. NPDC051992 TaxID=3161012 RepID=UPI003425A09F
MSLLGVRTAAMRQADAQAAQWEHGAKGEAATVRLLRPLVRWGWLRRLLGRPVWTVRHDLRLRGRRFNLDHVLVSPCGTAVVVLDTKNWHRGRTTALVGGRVHCGEDDRHGQVEKVAGYAEMVATAVGLRPDQVWPLIVVHGSPIAGGRLEARVPGQRGVVHVLGPDWLVPTLAGAPKARDPQRAAQLAGRVDSVLLPYTERG